MSSSFVRKSCQKRDFAKGIVTGGFEGVAADYRFRAVWLIVMLMLAQLTTTKTCSLFLRATSSMVVCLTIQGHGAK